MNLDTDSLSRRTHSAAGSDECPERSSPAWQDCPPKLGNFTRLHVAKLISSQDQRHVSPASGEQLSCHVTGRPTKLGDFGKVITTFQSVVSHEEPQGSAYPLGANDNTVGNRVPCPPVAIGASNSSLSPLSCDAVQPVTCSAYEPNARNAPFSVLERTIPSQNIPEVGSSSSDVDLDSESGADSEVDRPLTPASTPPSSMHKQLPWQITVINKRPSSHRQHAFVTPPSTKHNKSASRLGLLFSYHSGKDGSAGSVYEQLRTKEEKHESLAMDLIPHRALDAVMATKYPTVTANGTHVFVDMSNIDIGFQNALRKKYVLGEGTYFSPLPHLNLQFLTEVLVRGRHTVALNVGCSIVPGRQEPRYVQELRKLGYHVDLRERKRIGDPSSSDKTSVGVRYVEDLVDETLQTRIAESVMEYFQEQGTIVLATGDAKPAQYSDGFFTYVERALRMGWNVEVVSWKSSLSSTWANHKWKAQWCNRFRIIELDKFLDNLVACYL